MNTVFITAFNEHVLLRKPADSHSERTGCSNSAAAVARERRLSAVVSRLRRHIDSQGAWPLCQKPCGFHGQLHRDSYWQLLGNRERTEPFKSTPQRISSLSQRANMTCSRTGCSAVLRDKVVETTRSRCAGRNIRATGSLSPSVVPGHFLQVLSGTVLLSSPRCWTDMCTTFMPMAFTRTHYDTIK